MVPFVSLTKIKCTQPCKDSRPINTEELLNLYKNNISPDWTLNETNTKLSRTWKLRNFMAGIDFINKIALVAEEDYHHPDIHLTSWNNICVEIYTHATGGLTENDFVIAAKIDNITVDLKKSKA